MIGTLLWGKGGRKRLMNQVSALEAQRNATTVHVYIGEEATKEKQHPGAQGLALPEPMKETKFNVARHIPGEDILHIGTSRGPMSIRLNHKKTVDDILNVLSRTVFLCL